MANNLIPIICVTKKSIMLETQLVEEGVTPQLTHENNFNLTLAFLIISIIVEGRYWPHFSIRLFTFHVYGSYKWMSLLFLTNTSSFYWSTFSCCLLYHSSKLFAQYVFLSDRRSQWFATTHSKAGHISRKSQWKGLYSQEEQMVSKSLILRIQLVLIHFQVAED